MKQEIVYRKLNEITFTDIQRSNADQRRVARMAQDFDVSSVGSLVTSKHDDGTIVGLDGMHRGLAGIAAGFGDHEFPCNEFSNLTRAEEATLFLGFNDTRQVQPIDKFRVRVIANDAVAVEVNDILNHYGWQVKAGNADTNFNAVVSLEAVFRGCGISKELANPHLVKAVVNTITAAWGHDARGAHNAIIGGLGQLYARQGGRVDQKKLVSELQKVRPLNLVAKAQQIRDGQGGVTAAAMAKVLTGLHNNRRRSNLLPEWTWTR